MCEEAVWAVIAGNLNDVLIVYSKINENIGF